jgi:hypothetical protein
MNDEMIKRLRDSLWEKHAIGVHDWEVKALLSALTPADVMALGARCWQPIETAPKDGSEIILARIGENEVGKNLGVWWACSGSWSEKYSRWWDGIEPCGFNHPTHWMHLPAAPTPGGEG